MPLSASQIDHLAQLARLQLRPTEKKKFSQEISAILDYVNQLKEVKVPVLATPFLKLPQESNWREDKIEPAAPETVRQILENAPEKEGRLFKVKAVFE